MVEKEIEKAQNEMVERWREWFKADEVVVWGQKENNTENEHLS